MKKYIICTAALVAICNSNSLVSAGERIEGGAQPGNVGSKFTTYTVSGNPDETDAREVREMRAPAKQADTWAYHNDQSQYDVANDPVQGKEVWNEGEERRFKSGRALVKWEQSGEDGGRERNNNDGLPKATRDKFFK